MSCTIVTVCERARSVYQNAKNYEPLAIRFVRSLRKNGGSCADLPVVIWCSNDKTPSDATLRRLEGLGCSIVFGECDPPERPLFNKVTAMQAPTDTEYTMWADTDIFVLGDFSELFLKDKVDFCAPDNQYEFHKWVRKEDTPTWDLYYSMFGIEKPVPRMKTSIDGGEGNFYFNAGIVVFKSGIGFPELYKDTCVKVLNSSVEERELCFDQVALSLAVLLGGYSWKVVPEKHHLCYALRKKVLSGTTLVHYQDNRITEISDEDWNV